MRTTRGAVPLYFQIEATLRERLRSGQYAPCAPFPTEEALRQEFAVSRGTVRLALDALRRDGLILSSAGRGAVVSGRVAQPRTLRFEGSVEALIAHGTEMSFQITGCGHAVATDLEAVELKIPDGSRVTRISGVRLSGGRPVAHVAVSVPERLGVLLRVREGETGPPIAALIVERLGQTIREARQVIRVAIADQTVATPLGVGAGAPLLQIRRTYFAADGTPVEFAVSSYPGDRYQYETRISTRDET